ncbi:MAG: LL-diaminopimelate aminotransferase [Candidatus Margulisiibacteriota bacterium]|nr:MAG: aspartate aminotransferase [Candidatus Margulisbacteria bacterium GWD2_39_127]OGI02799.1 MAG: aspartate aminotransferase [Candidatus Margulisbacteria bacterium GWF2_38_17]OGI09314.1 MAG: aspartate aminotransferase [Candidatus Margulisbacteria bacterium GWE2_39_32]PZM77384.1 MAG: LL-diaminopimelate aminotransferase [Candidatus Margulisiibacteriota bacterium]HAR63963.1 aspartate aminotransferase [Candidatus Margulisiibacteriota bacterium]
MTQSYIQDLFAQRIGGNQFGKSTVLYKFEKIKRAKKAALEAHPGVELIDMGVGEPDWMAEKEVIDVLSEQAKNYENRGYADNGMQEFKDAVVRYLKGVYGVEGIDSIDEVNHAIGSKPALALMPYAFINPGDITIMTVPGYPVLGTVTQWLGGEVVNLPLLKKNDFLPDLDSLTADQKKRAKLLYINYPNNPCGAVATPDFYKKVVEFAKENNVVVVSDEAYSALVYDGEKPLSFLSVTGAKEVGVSIQSMSKAYNMTGWRLAYVVGNEKVVKAFAAVKDNNDSGQFKAIQYAGIYCLDHPEITKKTCEKYSRRLGFLAEALCSAGFSAEKPRGSFYLYVQVPKGIKGGIKFESAEDFSQYMITEKLISTVPWDDAGHFVRFSATFIAKDEVEERRVIGEIKKRLSGIEFEF